MVIAWTVWIIQQFCLKKRLQISMTQQLKLPFYYLLEKGSRLILTDRNTLRNVGCRLPIRRLFCANKHLRLSSVDELISRLTCHCAGNTTATLVENAFLCTVLRCSKGPRSAGSCWKLSLFAACPFLLLLEFYHWTDWIYGTIKMYNYNYNVKRK